MEVAIAYAEELGFYIINSMGDIVCAKIFPDWNSALDYCDFRGYTVVS